MAEAAVQILLECINLLQKQGFGIGGLPHHISKIKVELESMRSFLRDAERCKDRNEGVCSWVAQVRDAALKAEDVLDEFTYNTYRMKNAGFFHRAVYLPKNLWIRRETIVKLKKIKHEIKEIAERSKRYDLSHLQEDSTGSQHTLNYAQNIGETSFFVEEVVGKDDDSNRLLQYLTEGESQRTVISIVGMGGSGKTTLAAHAYNRHDVKKYFDCYAWVSVSQNYMIEDLLQKIINEFFNGREKIDSSPSLSTGNYKHLVETLANFLQGKKYLIVLDDVWTNTLWKQVSVALPDNRNGSRLIITTRKEDIASYPYGLGSHVLHSQPLSKSNAWDLFCRKAFYNEPGRCCPPDLEEIARTLVEKCDGLPLAILALGGLMASKDRSELKWKEFYDSLSWHISNNSLLDEVKTILLLSFKDLPYYLKSCLLYCCRFPIEHWTGAGRLIRMWMAEGFLEERKGLSPEDVGKIYLKELISRNLLQVEKHKSFLRPKLCKLHDLMWELARSLSEKEHFLSVYEPQDLEEEIRARSISIHGADSTVQVEHDLSHVRSFSAFNINDRGALPFDDLLLRFRLLRVLELRNAPIDEVPECIGKLFNLRYFSLRGTKIKELPNSIGRLRNLQTLDIRRTHVKELPKGIKYLHNLRHLLVYGDKTKDYLFHYIKGVVVVSSICKLKNLQVVNCLEANATIVKGISSLTQLRRLELTNVKEEDGRDLCTSLEKLQSLHHLLLMASSEDEYLQVDQLSSTPLVLRKLTLVGRLNAVPRWFNSLRNVIHLHLHWSRLAEDPIPYISQLHILERLTLVKAYSEGKKQLCFSAGFPRLEDLYLEMFPELVEIIISEGVMPNLARLSLHDCKKLKRVPQGIEHLMNLEMFDLRNVSIELVESIRGEDSIDCSRVKHISNIKLSCVDDSGIVYENLS